jgi:hypothetical protein
MKQGQGQPAKKGAAPGGRRPPSAPKAVPNLNNNDISAGYSKLPTSSNNNYDLRNTNEQQQTISHRGLMMGVMKYNDQSIIAYYATNKTVTRDSLIDCIASNKAIKADKGYSSSVQSQYTIHYFLDSSSNCIYIYATSLAYPPRVAFSALKKFKSNFSQEFGSKISNASDGSLTSSAKQMLINLFQEFADPTSNDKLTDVQNKINVVQDNMKENIKQVLKNDQKLENIEGLSLHINEQSIAFERDSKALREKMWWKMLKMRLLIGGLITAVLIIIIVPIAVQSNQASSQQKGKKH